MTPFRLSAVTWWAQNYSGHVTKAALCVAVVALYKNNGVVSLLEYVVVLTFTHFDNNTLVLFASLSPTALSP